MPQLSTSSALATTSRVAKALACLLAVVAVFCLAGCRDTDALKDIIYDQNASIIDYDNPVKYYINDSTAEQESNQVSSLEVSDEEPESDQVQNLVIYSSNPNTSGYTAKHAAFADPADFAGIEASDPVFFFLSDSVDAFNHAVTPVPEDDPEQTQDEEELDEQSQSEGDNQSEDSPAVTAGGTGEDGGGTSPTPTPDDQGEGAGEPENPVEFDDGTDGFTSTDGVGADKSFTLAFDIANRDANPPQVESIAAFGDYALIVQMVGGPGALAAADAETIAALQNAGVDTAAVAAWSGNSEDPSTLINVRAIVSSGAQVILVDDPAAYVRQISQERLDYLEENGVQWASLRDMFSSSNIKANVETVGSMLQGSTVAAYGSQAEERASHYASLHDRVVSGANGGLASDSVNGAKALQYDNDADGVSFSSNAATYTVLIDRWDAGATYASGGLVFDAGAAYASAGYGTTPVSYYIQAGGAINNAAALTTQNSSGAIPVLQFSQTESWNASMWMSVSVANVLYGVKSLLNSGIDLASTTTLGKGLGSDAMPKIIATSGDIKNAIVASSASPSSLYHAYPYVGNDVTYGALGVSYETSYGATSLWSCIGSLATSGTVGDPNPIYGSGAISADDVLVNPSGYFCDWTEGTVESFLEAGWVAAYVNGTYSASQWQQDVADFYSWAWGINVNMSTITNR